MARRQAQYDDQDDLYAEDEAYARPSASARRTTETAAPPTESLVHRAFDWGISGSILAIIVLTILYTFSPLDSVPDVVPPADQVDDLAAILAGGSSIAGLAVLRYLLHSKISQITCLIAIIFSAMGAFVTFWLLAQLFDRLL